MRWKNGDYDYQPSRGVGVHSSGEGKAGGKSEEHVKNIRLGPLQGTNGVYVLAGVPRNNNNIM